MLVQLSPIDAGAQELGLCRGFVWELPQAAGPAGDALVGALRQAVDDVVEKWRLLQGRPVWQAETRTWAIDVPTDAPDESRYAFTTSRVDQPYHEAIGASKPREPISPSAPSGEVHPFVVAHFRHADTPCAMRQYAKTGRPLLSVHVVRFSDAVSLGVSAPHGLFDGTGLAHVLAGISAELRGDEWHAPSALAANALSEARLRLMSSDFASLADDKVERPPVLRGWVPFSVLALLALLAQTLWDLWWHKDTLRYAFISRAAVDSLVAEVKEEVKAETEGKEWVSSGDALTAWTLKHFHDGDKAARGFMTCSPVFNIRPLLAESSPDLAAQLAAHTGNAVSPYPFSPEPIPLAHLASMSTGALALLHRRTLAGCKTLPWLRDMLLAGEELTQGGRRPMLPQRDWPWAVDTERGTTRWIVSNHMSAFADLRIPRAAAGLRTEGEGPEDLPLLAYYRHVQAPLALNATFALQLSERGLFVVASTRKARWESLMKAIDALDRRVTRRG